MKFLKDHGKSLFLVLILIVTFICICPIPRHIKYEADGWQLDISEEAMYEDKAEISIKGWYYQFLFFDDFMNLAVHIDCTDGEYQFDIHRGKPVVYQQGDSTFADVTSAHFDGAELRRVSVLSIEPWKDIIIEIEELQSQGEQVLGVFAASETDQSSLAVLIEEYTRLRVSNETTS